MSNIRYSFPYNVKILSLEEVNELFLRSFKSVFALEEM